MKPRKICIPPPLRSKRQIQTTGGCSTPKSPFFLGINIIHKDIDPVFFINFDQFLCQSGFVEARRKTWWGVPPRSQFSNRGCRYFCMVRSHRIWRQPLRWHPLVTFWPTETIKPSYQAHSPTIWQYQPLPWSACSPSALEAATTNNGAEAASDDNGGNQWLLTHSSIVGQIRHQLFLRLFAPHSDTSICDGRCRHNTNGILNHGQTAIFPSFWYWSLYTPLGIKWPYLIQGHPKTKEYNYRTMKWVMEICGAGRWWAGIIYYLTHMPHIATI